MPQAIFDVVAKDPKEKHVPEDVRQAAMHEHGSDQRKENRNRCRLQSRISRRLTGKLSPETGSPVTMSLPADNFSREPWNTHK